MISKEFADIESENADFDKAMRNCREEFHLSKLVLIDYALQMCCAHCSSGREDASCCQTCDAKRASDMLELFLNSHYERAKGEDLPILNIPKAIDRKVHDLEAFREFNDSVVNVNMRGVFDAQECIEKICEQCKDHHPDRAAAGECQTCLYAKALKALHLDFFSEEIYTCDHRPLSEKFDYKLNQF